MKELLSGFGWILVYIAFCLPGLLLLRLKTKTPDEVFRKLLHCVLLGVLLVWILVFQHWWIAAAACAGLVLLAYPVLWLFGKVPGFSAFVNERKQGEFRSSLVDVFLMFALVMAVCWGLLGDRWLVMASVYAWGFGDAAAALIGKRFGRHKISFKPICGKKSYEGTAAMFTTSFFCVLLILLLRGGLSLSALLVTAAVTAAVSALLELLTPNGHDTVTCPMGAMVTLIIFLSIFGGL